MERYAMAAEQGLGLVVYSNPEIYGAEPSSDNVLGQASRQYSISWQTKVRERKRPYGFVLSSLQNSPYFRAYLSTVPFKQGSLGVYDHNWCVASEGRMSTIILLAVLHGYVSIPPIRIFQPFPDVKCPAGYSVWWPQGKEFENDKYAECIKPIHRRPAKSITDVSLRKRVPQNR
jgi:hypothetical protein